MENKDLSRVVESISDSEVVDFPSGTIEAKVISFEV